MEAQRYLEIQNILTGGVIVLQWKNTSKIVNNHQFTGIFWIYEVYIKRFAKKLR